MVTIQNRTLSIAEWKRLIRQTLSELGEATLSDICYATGKESPSLFLTLQQMVEEKEVAESCQISEDFQTFYSLAYIC